MISGCEADGRPSRSLCTLGCADGYVQTSAASAVGRCDSATNTYKDQNIACMPAVCPLPTAVTSGRATGVKWEHTDTRACLPARPFPSAETRHVAFHENVCLEFPSAKQ